MSRYDDIINLPHHISATHRPMSLDKRAAQFAPFAALSGHEDALAETARLTADKKELTADETTEMSRRLAVLLDNMKLRPVAKFICFNPDKLKDGGDYVSVSGIIKKFDDYDRKLYLSDGRIIELDNVISIDSNLFDTI